VNVRIQKIFLSEIIEARLVRFRKKLITELDFVEARELPGGIILTGERCTPGIV